MRGGIRRRLAGSLAVVLALAAAMVEGQEYSKPADLGYSMAASDAAAMPAAGQPSYGAEQFVGADSGLAQRVAELECAMKKLDDKAKADKAKAAEKPSVSVFGRTYVDTVIFNQNKASHDSLGVAPDSTYFRSAWVGVKGDMFEVFSYKWEVDFASRDPQNLSLISFRDMYLQVKELPLLQNARVGHFKEPLSLEEQISSLFITFMERSLSNTFIPAYNTGIMTFGSSADERATWAIGAFAAGQDTPPYVRDDSDVSGEGTSGTARVTWTPWYDEATAGRGLIHLGLGYRYCDLTAPTQRVRARPEVAVGPNVVDTRIGGIDTLTEVENSQTLNPEFAAVYGPFSVQAEYFAQTYTRAAGNSNPVFNGGYIFASYFLTGECRAYNRREGRFERVKPFENFFRVRGEDQNVYTGKGAWELAYRYSWIDLNQGGILGGIACDHTFGVTWYLTPYSRLMLNVVHSMDSPNNNQACTYLNVVAMRAQFDF